MGNISGNTGWKEGKRAFCWCVRVVESHLMRHLCTHHTLSPRSHLVSVILFLLLVISPSLHCIRLPMCSNNFPWFFCIFPCTCCVVTAPSSCQSFVWLCKFIPTPSALTLCPWLSASLSFALIQWTQNSTGNDRSFRRT